MPRDIKEWETVINMLLGSRGIPVEYLVQDPKVVAGLIEKYGLQPVRVSGMEAAGAAPGMKAAPAMNAFIDLDIPGGIRFAHLHFDHRIYVLTEKQWADFSTQVMSDLKTKLANVKQVPFEVSVVLANAIQQSLNRG